MRNERQESAKQIARGRTFQARQLQASALRNKQACDDTEDRAPWLRQSKGELERGSWTDAGPGHAGLQAQADRAFYSGCDWECCEDSLQAGK